MAPGIGVAYVVFKFPTPSETFIQREISAVRQLGVRTRILTLEHSSDPTDASKLAGTTPRVAAVVLRAACCHPARVLHLVRICVRIARGGGARAYASTLRWLPRGIYFGTILSRDPPKIVHAHFALAPATVARMVAAWCGLPWGVSVHAHDLYVTGASLSRRLETARHVLACSEASRDDLRSLVPAQLLARVHTVHHGVPQPSAPLPRASEPWDCPTVLAVGRFVEKKGYSVLIDACAELRDRGFRFRCRLIGAGRLEGALRAQIRALRLEAWVSLVGWITPRALAHEYRTASVLAVPSVVAPDGDRDNIPNVLLEALAAALPVVASDLPALRRLLEPTSAARIFPQGDAGALAGALQSVCADPQLAQRLRASGSALVAAQFDLERNATRLVELLEASAGGSVRDPRATSSTSSDLDPPGR